MDRYLGDALSSMYVRDHFADENKQKVGHHEDVKYRLKKYRPKSEMKDIFSLFASNRPTKFLTTRRRSLSTVP
jgi:23S rRNA maturation mini-RNase III